MAKDIETSGGLQKGTLISESGLFKLIMRAHPDRRPHVREFQDWVTRVVLPAIRKDVARSSVEASKAALPEYRNARQERHLCQTMSVIPATSSPIRANSPPPVNRAKREAVRTT